MFLKRMVRRRLITLPALIILLAVILTAVFAPFVAPYDPQITNARERLRPPSSAHILGTDRYGRDMMSRVIFSGRYSLSIALAVTLVALGGGAVAGLLAGYFKRLEAPIMRVVDSLMAMPSLLVALALVAIWGPGFGNVVLALGITYMPRIARVTRASVLTVREEMFVEASRAMAAGTARILFKHILPNVVSPLIVQSTLVFAFALVAEASLSYLGVGIPSHLPTWGSAISDGRDYMRVAPWLTVYPGGVLMFVVLSVNLLGDALRDALDPRLARLTS